MLLAGPNMIFTLKEFFIAKGKNPVTFAKRVREQEKKRKADEKLARRVDRNKESTGTDR